MDFPIFGEAADCCHFVLTETGSNLATNPPPARILIARLSFRLIESFSIFTDAGSSDWSRIRVPLVLSSPEKTDWNANGSSR